MTNGWPDEQLQACLMANFGMLGKELAGVPYSKAEVRRMLLNGPTANRSEGSVEFRMQKLSDFIQQRGEPNIQGYQPRGTSGKAWWRV